MEDTWLTSFADIEKNPRFNFFPYQCHYWREVHSLPSNDPKRVSFEREFFEHLKHVCDVLIFLCDSYIVSRHMIEIPWMEEEIRIRLREKYIFTIFNWGVKIESVCKELQILVSEVEKLLWSKTSTLDDAVSLSKRVCVLTSKLS